ncbi:MAG: aspartyl/glutamyl-tRNA amidotransferase subunit C, partial [Dehalococcoidia bacterium]|nr:aspartyl/glutamyl-tRNA amidotransferase subunit C [Dehalococcoidia bacterium]
MPLSREEVLHIASLVRMGLSDQEVERMREQLSNILEQFQVLQEL